FSTCRNNNDFSRVGLNGNNTVNLYDTCRNQLVVNGGILAYRIKWLLTFGSLRNSQDPGHLEYPGTPTASSVAPLPFRACENAGTLANNGPIQGPSLVNICAAEIVIQSPLSYLSGPPMSADGYATTFDYISSLAPLL
ncbi:MAG: hypothetical protein AAB459_00385, partial [Patescibacteria group bacterium]